MMGLGNAATPFGIKAMMELDRLNPAKGTASDAMVTFLAINTSGLALLPTGVIGLRASLGSKDAAGILFPTWFGSAAATVVAVTAAILLSRLPHYRATAPGLAADGGAATPAERANGSAAGAHDGSGPAPRWRTLAALLFAAAFVSALGLDLVRSSATVDLASWIRKVLSYWILPGLIAAIVLYGWARGVKVYSSLVEGAKEGFEVALRIIPYLVAILVMVGLFRASGGVELLVALAGPLTERIGMPIGGLVYVPGGRTESGSPTDVTEVYDPRQDIWEQRAPLPLPLSAYALAALEGQLYVFGGWDGVAYVIYRLPL